jgi:methylase of polypeptide subunit release factors
MAINRKIIENIDCHLKDDGFFVIELAEYNADSLLKQFSGRFSKIAIVQDYAQKDRFLFASR